MAQVGMPSPLYAAAAQMAGAAAAAFAESADGAVSPVFREYLVDNAALMSCAPGLAYRRSCRVDDKDPGRLVGWGEVVSGVNEGNGWVRVGDRYLPFVVDGARVLLPVPARDDGMEEEVALHEQAEDAYREIRPLEGALVEIRGAGLATNLAALSEDDDSQKRVDVEGQQGLCVAWLAERGEYVVQTLDGILMAVREENLQLWTPPPPEEGGFDLPWFDDAREDDEYLFALVVQSLATKGYCVVQTFLNRRERKEALEGAEEGRPFQRMKQELESGYLGYDNITKVGPLVVDDGRASEDAAEHAAEAVLHNSGARLTTLARILGRWTPTHLGFSCHGVTSPMVRTSIDRSEEDELFPESIRDDEDSSEWSALVEAYVRFAQRRRLCAMHMIENRGGDLWLYPKGKSSSTACVHIPITPNKILLFRHDVMDYSYQVEGPSLAVQTWVLDTPGRDVHISNLQVNMATPGEVGQILLNVGPITSTGPVASVMSLSNRMSGDCWSPDHWLNAVIGGTDCDIKWPESRWDTEPYYEEGGDAAVTGKAYTCHGGFLSQAQITSFDNEFFHIGREEARTMIPGQRLVMEVGYACLYKAGLRRQTMEGRRVGSWLGDVGPDWNSFQTEWGFFFVDDPPCPTQWATSMSCICTAGRLAHCFDMRGPVSSYDTACSSSLIALNAAHSAMFRRPDAGKASVARGLNDAGMAGEDCTEALVGGVNTMLGPGSFVGNCMANMLTHKGRCFTFTDSADGYQRADACGMIFLRIFDGSRWDLEQRVCALTGTCCNADGRSASLTAPSGPAQQKLLRKSIDFSGIEPSQLTYAECHGTGTPLGDPIEVGAAAAVLCQDRQVSLVVGSHKSNTGHSEAAAGISGLTKCILFVGMQAVPPNCHFNVLNPNISHEGFPIHFASEAVDTGVSECFCGVSSFGFGGSNARADISGRALSGPRESFHVELPRLNVPREIPIGQALYICGSWSDWSEFERMDGGRDGIYTCFVQLAASRRVEFHLSCNPNTSGAGLIHPLVPRAPQHSQIIGPDDEGDGMNFLIDGVADGVPSGTIYRIEFVWKEDKRRISWLPFASEGPELAVLGREAERRFSLAGTWLRSGELLDMYRGEDGVYRGRFSIGVRSQEEFHIVADRSRRHLVYPATRSCDRVLGPDDERGGRSWLVRGRIHEVVEVELRVSQGRLSVKVDSPSMEARTWTS